MFYVCITLGILAIIFYLIAKAVEKRYNKKQGDDYIALYCIIMFLVFVCAIGTGVCIFILINNLLN